MGDASTCTSCWPLNPCSTAGQVLPMSPLLMTCGAWAWCLHCLTALTVTVAHLLLASKDCCIKQNA